MPYLTSKAVCLLTLAFTTARADTQWCTFWNDDKCEERSGSVNYATNNDGILQNGGEYFSCNNDEEFSFIEYPPGDSAGDSPDNCYVFGAGYFSSGYGICQDLGDLGFMPGDGGYYRISPSKTCPSIGKRDANDTASSALVPKRKGKSRRDANYLYFYDDPDCSEQVGGVGYSTGNQGCFQNSGSYAYFYGDDTDWHMEQYSGADDTQCTGTDENCAEESIFLDADAAVNTCVYLPDHGYSPGYGSYKIARHGCA